jgi:hypothetical protein
MIQQELNEWDENVKAFVKEKQMTKDEQEKFLEQYDFYLFRGGNPDVEWFYNELYGGREEIKNDVSVSSRLKHITDEEHLKIVDFIIDYSFKDSQEVYTNGTILVPLFRVLAAISQKGKQYQEGGNK